MNICTKCTHADCMENWSPSSSFDRLPRKLGIWSPALVSLGKAHAYWINLFLLKEEFRMTATIELSFTTMQWPRNRKRNARFNELALLQLYEMELIHIQKHSNIICISTYQKKQIDAIKGSAYNFNSMRLQM